MIGIPYFYNITENTYANSPYLQISCTSFIPSFPFSYAHYTVSVQGFAVPKESQGKVAEFSFRGTPAKIKHGDVVIAAITSCTNTSNPTVMLGAALVAKKACDLGLEVRLTVLNFMFSDFCLLNVNCSFCL